MAMEKVRALAALAGECREWRKAGKRVVWTNGCFDLFHAGHARALEAARARGDVLIVGLNSDRSVRELKGPGRPLMDEHDRAAVLSSLEAVTRVLIFDGGRCDRELAELRPDVWTKSGDYTPESLDPAEREAVLSHGGKIVITPLVAGVSTTLLVKKIRRCDPEKVVSAACARIRNKCGHTLFVATRYADGVKWSLPGGGHHHGESLPDAARRETLEETGLEVDIGRHMGVIERIDPAGDFHLVLHLFEAAPLGAAGLRTHDFAARSDPYVEEVAWFSPERLREETRIVFGRGLWLSHGGAPESWPPYLILGPGDE